MHAFPDALADEALEAPAGAIVKDVPLKVMILGSGRVVSDFYLPALIATNIAEAVSVVDVNEENLYAGYEVMPTARRVQQSYRSFLSELPESNTDLRTLVIVALPNQLHVEACELALQRGLPVLCEKPLSLSSAECQRLSALATETGSMLRVAMARRYLPSWMLARQIIGGGELGRICAVELRDCSPFKWRPRSLDFFAPEAGGVLADMGVHYLDFLALLFGPLTPVAYSDDSKGGNESNCTYRLASHEPLIEMVLSRTHAKGAFCCFNGEKGKLTIMKSDERQIELELHGQSVRHLVLAKPFSQEHWPSDFRGSFCQMLVDQWRAIAGESSNAATSSDAEHAARLIEWAYAQRAAKKAIGVVRRDEPARTLVTGGTGFIGGHLVDRLVSQGDQLKCLVRSPATVANLARYPIRFQQIDLLDRQAVCDAMRGIRNVYHLAYGREGHHATAITVEGTKNVVEAAIDVGAESVVVLSSTYVFGFPTTDRPIDETFGYQPTGGIYGMSKATMEQWCLKRAQSSRTRITVLNPTNVFGPEGSTYTVLPVTLAKSGAFCWLEHGQGLCNYTFVDNLIDAIQAASREPAAHGTRFIINDGAKAWIDFLGPFVASVCDGIPSYSLAEFQALMRTAPKFRIADLAREIVASQGVRDVASRSRLVQAVKSTRLREFLPRLLTNGMAQTPTPKRMPSLPPYWLAELYHTNRVLFSARLAARVLGWRPRIAWEDARDRTLAWLKETGHLERQLGPN
jgi:nucleoside-diphosphate-sugar epimerase/predicted dehydrogenase